MMRLIKLLLFLPAVTCRRVCHICGADGNTALSFPTLVLNEFNRSCGEIAVAVATSVDVNSELCQRQSDYYASKCCNLKEKPAGKPMTISAPIAPPVDYKGPNRVCNICRDGDYPYKTSMVVSLLYLGSGSCAQYFVYGREGRIPQYLCSAVKYFFYEPCGCGKHNPFFRYYSV